MSEFINLLDSYLQFSIKQLEWVMLFTIIGGGFYLFFISKGYPLLKIKSAFKLLFTVEQNKGISRFQALSAVLAATVGLGNISGVAIAIHMGGPGVLVWMWITAIIGMIIKFYSSSLSVILREKQKNGDPLGGPMYYMSLGIKRWGKPLAIWFSIAGLFGVLPAFTANQLSQTFMDVLKPNNYVIIGDLQWKFIIGTLLSIASGFVIFGGLKSIVKVTSSPILYVAVGLEYDDIV